MQSIIMILVMLGLFYFMAIRPQKKREKEVNEMRSSIKAGDEIITIGGIYGKVFQAKEDYIVIEVIPSKVKMKFTKWAVSSVVNSKAVKEIEEEVDEVVEEIQEESETE
ncbi:MAG: preprotein translocase subunit YajC [Tissierellia bacterium]|nr:preprotein translocase subunit YajC [Tissierellia bacterium]